MRIQFILQNDHAAGFFHRDKNSPHRVKSADMVIRQFFQDIRENLLQVQQPVPHQKLHGER